MNFALLTKEEKKVIAKCVLAIAEGPFIPEDLFPTLMGFGKIEYIQFVNNWTQDRIKNNDEENYIYNALLHLLEYPHGKDDIWFDYIPVSKNDVVKIFYKFLGTEIPVEKKWNDIIKGYFTPKAQILWDKIDKKTQRIILTNIWCPHCSQKTTITNYEGGLNNLNEISIYGKCVRCFNQIETTLKESGLVGLGD